MDTVTGTQIAYFAIAAGFVLLLLVVVLGSIFIPKRRGESDTKPKPDDDLSPVPDFTSDSDTNRKRAEARIEELEDQISMIHSRHARELDEANRQLDEAEKRIEELETANRQAKQRVRELEAEKADANDRFDEAFEAQKNAFETRIKELKEAADEENLNAWKKRVEELDEANRQGRKYVEELEAEKEEARARIKQLESTVDKLLDEVARLTEAPLKDGAGSGAGCC
jgi:chromosome segregation ATPase